MGEDLYDIIEKKQLNTDFQAMSIIRSPDVVRETLSGVRPSDVPANWIHVPPQKGERLHEWKHPHYESLVLNRLKIAGFI